MKPNFLPVIRELARSYQAFTHYSASHIRELGLTPPQFDVICTLGDTQGMPLCKLAEKTLITKGTLTGVIDRLEDKGLLKRVVPPENRRSFIAVLTPEGEKVYNSAFPAHIEYLEKRLGKLSGEELDEIRAALEKLRNTF
jgi:DNA-binding MarR family transcriptional regulator